MLRHAIAIAAVSAIRNAPSFTERAGVINDATNVETCGDFPILPGLRVVFQLPWRRAGPSERESSETSSERARPWRHLPINRTRVRL